MPAEFLHLTQLKSISDCLVQITAFFKITDLNNSHMIIIFGLFLCRIH